MAPAEGRIALAGACVRGPIRSPREPLFKGNVMSIYVEYPGIAVWANGDVAPITPAQRDALERIASRWGMVFPIVVRQMLAVDGVIMVTVPAGMVIGIELDGYAHT